MLSGLPIDSFMGLIALTFWINWKSGHIQKALSYVSRNQIISTSILNILIIASPFLIRYSSWMLLEAQNAQDLISLFPPTAILVAVGKDYIDRRRLKKSLLNELLLNYKNISYLIETYQMLGNGNNLHRSLENQWLNSVYKNHVVEIISGNIVDQEIVDTWTSLYGKMETAINSINSCSKPFIDDEFLFELFLEDRNDGVGVLEDMKKIINCLNP